MPRIEKRVTEKQKTAWQIFCQNQGVKESEMLGLVLEKVTDGLFEADFKSLKTPKSGQVSIRLNDKNMNQMTERAKNEGFPSRTTWLANLALSTLDGEPVFTDSEINTLRDSNRQMSAIGRNLNQIARVLNTDFRASDKITKELVEQLSKRVDEHQDEVVKLLNKSMNRWGSE